MILAIDFDGVLHNPYKVQPGYKMGIAVAGAVEAMQELAKENKLIIHTIWGDTPQRIEAVADWLDYFKIPYSNITNIKPVADFYIDDHAIRFESWEQTLKDIKELHE